MFTRQEAEKRGWTFPTDADGFVLAVNPAGDVRAKVMSDIPYFFAVEHAAIEEGEPFTDERNTASILAVSGETYVEPPPPPSEPVVLSAEEKQAALFAEVSKLDPKTATVARVIAAIKKTLA